MSYAIWLMLLTIWIVLIVISLKVSEIVNILNEIKEVL